MAVLVALLAVSLVALLAFTTDFGIAYAQKQALATGTDSGALAIARAQYFQQIKSPTRTCLAAVAADTALASSDPTKSSNVALRQINANAPFSTPLTASDVTTTLSCTNVSTGATCTSATDTMCAMTVAVSVTKRQQRTFGKALGTAPITVTRSASAGLGVRNSPLGVMPFGLCQFQANKILNDAATDATNGVPYRAEIVTIDKVWGAGSTCDGGGGSGNWGWLDVGQGNGASALGDLIGAGGSTAPITLTGTPPSLTLTGSPGNKGVNANVHAGMSAAMDKTVIMPVYDTVTGNGDNASYHVIGFMSVKMCGYDGGAEKGACYDSGVPLSGNDMQVRFVNYTTVGDFNAGAGLGGSTNFGSYVIGLVK